MTELFDKKANKPLTYIASIVIVASASVIVTASISKVKNETYAYYSGCYRFKIRNK